LGLTDQLALKSDDGVEKRVEQFKHLAARPAAYATDEVFKSSSCAWNLIDLMALVQ
jgi:hypothetical protein